MLAALVPAGGGGLAGQGHRRLRGCAHQHADRLRARCRPQWHRRHPAQLDVHPGEPGRDARAAGRRHPRQQPQHQERGRGDGHRHAAAVRPAGQPHRRGGERSRRLQVAARRHAAGDPAAGCGRRGLRGGAGCVEHRWVRGAGRRRDGDPRRADGGAYPGRCDHRAGGPVRARRHDPGAGGAAQSRLHDGRADRRRDQRAARARRRRGPWTRRRWSCRCRQPMAAAWPSC